MGRDPSLAGLVEESAAENMWDDLLFDRISKNTVPPYKGGKAALVEIPPETPLPLLHETLFGMRLRGVLPILAHVERYDSLMSEREWFLRLRTRAP